MEMETYIQQTQADEIIDLAKETAKSLSIPWSKGLDVVFKTCLSHPELSPRNIKGASGAQIVGRWLSNYKNGFDQRPSARASELPGTVADPIIDEIIHARLPKLADSDIGLIKSGHRLSMSAENALGLLLEEYLADELLQYGWHCCWGAVVRSVDFCHENGRLLQIKNRSNSENSSSSQVRKGTEIKAWFRVVATNGAYKWSDLNLIVGCKHLSEESFRKYVAKTIAANPALIAVEVGNSWLDR